MEQIWPHVVLWKGLMEAEYEITNEETKSLNLSGNGHIRAVYRLRTSAPALGHL